MRIDCKVKHCNELCAWAFIHFSLKKNADEKSLQSTELPFVLWAEPWAGPADHKEQGGGWTTAQRGHLAPLPFSPEERVCCFSFSITSSIASSQRSPAGTEMKVWPMSFFLFLMLLFSGLLRELWGAGDWPCWDRDWQPWRAHMGSWATLSLLMWVVSLVFSFREHLFFSFMPWGLACFCFLWQERCDSKQSPLNPPPFKPSLLRGYKQGAASLGQAYSSFALSLASVWGAEAAYTLAWPSRWLPGTSAA